MKRNKGTAQKILSVLAALVLLCGMITLPAGGALATSVTYGKTTANNVFVRKSASISADYWFSVPLGWVATVVGQTNSGGILWYKVTVNNPVALERTYTGYIHGNFFTYLTDAEEAAWIANPIQAGAAGPATATPSYSAVLGAGEVLTGYVKTTSVNVNMRIEPSGDTINQIPNSGTVVPYYGTPVTKSGYIWYKVFFNGVYGFVRSDVANVSTETSSVATPTPVGLVTAPAGVATATPAPSTMRYIKTVLDKVNIRKTPDGESFDKVAIGVVLPVTGSAINANGFTWYPVTYSGKAGYLRGDCISECDANGNALSSATGQVFGYVKLVTDMVNLRAEPAGSVVTQLGIGGVYAFYAMPTVKSGYTWYYVKAGETYGYVRSDCITLDVGSTITAPPAVTAAPVPTAPVSYGAITLTANNVNLRSSPYGNSLMQLPKGTVMSLVGSPVASGAYTWYPVSYSNVTGYIRGDCASYTGQSVATSTPAGATPTPATGSYGYVRITKNNVNVRRTYGGTVIGQVQINVVCTLSGAPAVSGGYTWYPIIFEGNIAYVRGDCALPCDASGNLISTPTAAPSGNSNYIITTMDKVYIRTAASTSASAPYQVPLGTVIYFSGTTSSGGVLWYKVRYDNQDMYMMGSCARIMTAAEYAAYIASQPTATPPAILGYIKMSSDNVNLRKTEAGEVLAQLSKGTIFAYRTAPTSKSGYSWYFVTTTAGVSGYVRSDCITLCKEDGTDLSGGTSGTEKPEATYSTLRKGSTGEAVKALTAALKEQGFFTSAITDTYTDEVINAVTAFQTAKGLTADGVAGPATQHMLYGTVPVGTSTGSVSYTQYPAEKMDWFTSDIQSIFAKGTTALVVDVYSGVAFWVKRWSGFNHADVEPLTAADTARMCKAYDVKNAAEIESKNLWQRHPVWVIIGTRMFCGSMYGIPHNEDEGNTILDNNYNGQFCIHFTNSMTSVTKVVDSLHQAAIQYAYDHANSRK